ncbi:pyocin knob domain-containing protein [uncultured Lactobacillus sp.]|uniref:pyocin knob domain-containing protein n=1 Tax=uncultured Lactobacillus sp. TaxID=153152 RepID=UPI0028063836|nr:pyocin knob domain-containing protein [uncultured Lactobacillus sp.]
MMSTSIELKGNYNPNEDYEVLNVVNFGGKTFVVVRSNRKIAPTDTQYWAMVEKGEPGPSGQNGKDGHSPKVEVRNSMLYIDNVPQVSLKGIPGSMTTTQEITANDDLNSYTENNFYVGPNILPKNGPWSKPAVGIETHLFSLQVIGWLNGVYATQQIIDMQTGAVYTRGYSAGTWTKWHTVYAGEHS